MPHYALTGRGTPLRGRPQRGPPRAAAAPRAVVVARERLRRRAAEDLAVSRGSSREPRQRPGAARGLRRRAGAPAATRRVNRRRRRRGGGRRGLRGEGGDGLCRARVSLRGAGVRAVRNTTPERQGGAARSDAARAGRPRVGSAAPRRRHTRQRTRRRPSAAPPPGSHAPPRAAPQGRSPRAGRPPRRGVSSRRPARAAAGTPAPAPQTAAWPPAQTRHPREAPWLRSRGSVGKGYGVEQRRSSARFRAKAGTDLWEPDIFALISQKKERPSGAGM